MTHRLLMLPGDHVGPEILAEADKLLRCLMADFGLDAELEYANLGGCAVDAEGEPFPRSTQRLAEEADALILGAVGGPQWDGLDRDRRPETGLLAIRSALGLFANLRPAILFPELVDASSLRPDVVSGLDILIVRELTGGIYFGQPRGIRTREDGTREGYNTLVYGTDEIERIGRAAFEAAARHNGSLCSVDKANVLESSELWREVMESLAPAYPNVRLSHMYVDNAAMQLVRDPRQFDVIVTGNLFGDILSDCAAMLTGSIGMLPSASLDERGRGLYEPVHGSAPDISGEGVANPLATLLSVAMMLRHSLDEGALADRVERAVGRVLADGHRTADLAGPGVASIGTVAMGDAVVNALREARD
ncbi:3-isopropylmalate dehydrogenase [Spiribacter onubensis]|uniref:3-isopropylmalate dehydrogenase n=1 Tax=Spiribacter onubensis TaxID=3122420 RepID=A0ABV3S642_9GAMM